ncbi:MAG: A/G-specific adenine glycosylase [Bacteroidales bacterium]|jgi:A/G-specific adenine glycosylase|nr:A/G-specific adenine glycosylase [Bacteroidales bacterium]
MNPVSAALLIWYKNNKRILPWREITDPYHIWISEVILQQTRVNQGVDYYLRFVEQWPDVKQLASASEQEVLKMWQGLGYYSRARNMLVAAQEIVNKYNGLFPRSADELKKLKGIGDYTAAAISSIAFDEPVAVIDGNVFRVLSRLFNEETPIDSSAAKTTFRMLADSLLDKSNPGEFNQAIMEFGALHCVPKNPDCRTCPLQDSCLAFALKKVDQLPVKKNKIKIRKRFLHYFIFLQKEQQQCFTLLKHRGSGDVWQGLYDFPCIESDRILSIAELDHEQLFTAIKTVATEIIPFPGIRKHILTHQHLTAKFYVVKCKNGFEHLKNNSLSLVSQTELGNYPLPRLIDQFLHENENLFDNC